MNKWLRRFLVFVGIGMNCVPANYPTIWHRIISFIGLMVVVGCVFWEGLDMGDEK